jgi:S1-C subfamily serine protease
MDEQNSDRQSPGFWESWTASADQSGQPEDVQASTPGDDDSAGPSQLADPAQPGPAQSGSAQPGPAQPASAQPEPAQPGPAEPWSQHSAPGGAAGHQPAAFTQPLGFPQPGFSQPPPGYGQPGGYSQAGGYAQAGSAQPGSGQPGGGQPGYGGRQGYNQPGYGGQPGGGFGQPPGGGYGMPGGYGQPPRPPRPRRSGLTTAITYIAVAAIAAAAGGLVVAFTDSGHQQPSASSGAGNGNFGNGFGGNGFGNNPFSGNGSNGSGNGVNPGGNISQSTLQKVQSAVQPGLVVITSNLKYNGNAAAAATGMVISKSGLVLTNNHVINGTTGLTATVVATHRQYTAKWLGYDKGSDIAVIQLEGASGLTTVPLGDSSSVQVGDDVVGMGNGGGTGSISTVAGSVTGLNQTITASDDGSGAAPERLTGMIETNANIIPGDSGGPLASTDGKVIGMDTAASTGSITNNQQDVGFAIPINKALAIARQIIAGQQGAGVQIGTSGFVGVLVPSGQNGAQSTATSPSVQLRQQEANQQSIGQTNPAPTGCLQGNTSPGVPTKIAPVGSGTLVLGSLCQTPAAAAGLVAGDVITKVNSQPVTSPASLMNLLKAIHGGSTVSLTWITPSDQTVTQTLTLAAAPPQ